jgi:cobalt-zinc-cadmium efflux system protein
MHDHGQHAIAQGERGTVDRAFAIGVGLNSIYVVAEFVYGVLADSVALLADAAHNLGDVLGLLIAWGAAVLARRQPSGRRTYGLRKSTVLAALVNAVILIAATGALAWEAIERLANPPEPAAVTMMAVAGIGVVINTASALILLRHGHGHDHGGHDHGHDHGSKGGDLNLRGAFLHMAADAGVSLGVVVTGAALMFTGWRWLDPAVSLVIALVIFATTWSLLREALDLTLDAAPKHIDLDGIREYLDEQPGVVEVHDLHVWALGTRDVALTAHLVVEGAGPELIASTEQVLGERFGIAHSTLQLEANDEHPCPQRC